VKSETGQISSGGFSAIKIYKTKPVGRSAIWLTGTPHSSQETRIVRFCLTAGIIVLACGGSGGSYRGNFCSQKGYQAQRNLPQLELSPQDRIDHLRHSYGSSNSALPLHNGVWGRLWLRRVYGASALPQPEPNYYVIATGYDHTYTSFLSARSNA
jgi:hypothetical protein